MNLGDCVFTLMRFLFLGPKRHQPTSLGRKFSSFLNETTRNRSSI